MRWLMWGLLACGQVEPLDHPSIVNSQNDEWVQGLIKAPGRTEVLTHCTSCHDTKPILQKHLSRAEWDKLITWMQQVQGLRVLQADDRTAILDYLERTQGPAGK